MAAIQAFYQRSQYCLDDKTMLEFQLLEIQSTRSGSEQPASLYMSFHYCPTCNSYSTDQGMSKDPVEAARSLKKAPTTTGQRPVVLRNATHFWNNKIA